MSHPPSVSFDDLQSAFDWVSSAGRFEDSALISRETGQVFFSSMMNDTEEDLPEDIEDDSLYLSVPHKNELDLGKSLVLRFVERSIPDDLAVVEGYFRRRGAYGRFKDLLERRSVLEDWYAYESSATKEALLDWAKAQNLVVTDTSPPSPPASGPDRRLPHDHRRPTR